MSNITLVFPDTLEIDSSDISPGFMTAAHLRKLWAYGIFVRMRRNLDVWKVEVKTGINDILFQSSSLPAAALHCCGEISQLPDCVILTSWSDRVIVEQILKNAKHQVNTVHFHGTLHTSM